MINKLAKAQKSWIAKLIFTLTGLSFMSLFGISGYLSSAGSNRTVIKVDNIEISQAQFSYLMQKEMNMARQLLGDNSDLNDDIRDALLQTQTKQLVQNAVLDRTQEKYHMLFSPALVQNIIVNDPAFHDNAGNFNRDLFRRILSQANMSENDFVRDIKRNLARRILIDLPAGGVEVPEVMRDAELKVDNKRRTFKYVFIRPGEISVKRKMSEDEVVQYYTDFEASFIEPERRDLNVLYISMADIEDRMQISDEDVKFYYEENKREFETPETRQVLQMMFEDEKTANKAFFELQNGKDFYMVAEELANQSREDTELGYAAEDELVFEVADEVFKLTPGAFTKPVQVGDMWQVLSVKDVKPGSKVPYAEAAAKITEILKDEKLYDESYAILRKMEDALGSGADLDTLAAGLQLKLLPVSGLAEDGSVKGNVPAALADLTASQDFIDTAFSYNAGETSQVLETDNGLAVVRVERIADAHPQALEDVRGQIEQMWVENEKTAVAQEMLNDVMHDLENGDDLATTAKRYELALYKSQPITRNETFANIGYADIRQMFTQPLQTPNQIQQGADYVIAVADKDYDNSVPLSESEQLLAKQKAYQSLVSDFAEALLSSYAEEYDIRIKYNLMGFEY